MQGGGGEHHPDRHLVATGGRGDSPVVEGKAGRHGALRSGARRILYRSGLSDAPSRGSHGGQRGGPIGNEHSAVFDSLATLALPGGLVKTVTWYDNGWGYATRVVELIERLSELGQHTTEAA